jgi:hypothetical protein
MMEVLGVIVTQQVAMFVLLRKEKNLNNQNVWYWNLYVDLQSQSWA